MRLLIKQRVFLWTNSYDVYDEEGNPSSTFPNSCYPGGAVYVIDINDPADELDGLMLVIAIDAANCTQGAS